MSDSALHSKDDLDTPYYHFFLSADHGGAICAENEHLQIIFFISPYTGQFGLIEAFGVN